ncbi:MAG: hypothetical protein WA799_08755 [Nitrosotalea sp.]
MIDLTFILNPVVGAIGGALIGTVLVRHFGIRERRRKSAWDLYKRYQDIDFRHIRSSVYTTSRNWGKSVEDDEDIILWFLDIGRPHRIMKTEKNELNPYQNLSMMLYFWSEVCIGIRDKFIDKKLMKELFSYLYNTYSKFFDDFLIAYNNFLTNWKGNRTKYQIEYSDKPSIKPLWVTTIPLLKEQFREG